jgi:hypothetical protein
MNATIIPFPGTPSESGLFTSSATPTTGVAGIAGLAVQMMHRPCRLCGSVNFVITSSAAMHHAGLRCLECNRHNGWPSKGAFVFLEMTIARFGLPTQPVTVRSCEGF